MRTLLLCIAVSGLSACGDWRGFVKAADPCAEPVEIPGRWLNDREVEKLWMQDRVELLNCADKVETLSGRSVERNG